MYITLESDYAIRIVSCLASEKQRLDAKTIAEKACVSLRFSLKILRKLVSAGIIKSFKGIQGGYELKKAPADISLKDIIETIEGEYMLNRCLDSDYLCSRGKSGECIFQDAFKEVSTLVNKKLEGYTFDKLKEENNN
ncbi:MAG: Rrf2 family transcriptional regulator [Oscillospiraceae bacterium]|jgi:Rrf2 family protein